MRLPATLPRPIHADRVVPLLLGCAGLVVALVVGVLVARSPTMGVALGAAAIFAPMALVDLPLALAVWTATLFLRLIPGVGLATSMAGLVIIAAWIGATAGGRVALRAAVARLRGITLAALSLLLWLGITMAWATNQADAQNQLLYWFLAVLLMAIVVTTLDTAVRIRLVVGAFVIGATASVLAGVVSGDLTAGMSAAESAALEGRFSTAGADPNDLAAGLVPAAALAVGLMAGTRGPKRLALVIAFLVLVGGTAATQSRGGLLAAACAVLAAIVVARGRRLPAAAFTFGVVIVATFILSTTPGALERITNTDNGGNGRTDLWTVAGRMVADHPIVGVGLNQFREESSNYVRAPGTLDYVDLIVEQPHVVHNTYLQLLAETGAIGLALYLLVAGLALAASWHAARLMRERGRPDLEALAQAVFVGQVGILAASTFLSIGDDFRAWLLLGLGPALLALARGLDPSAVVGRGER